MKDERTPPAAEPQDLPVPDAAGDVSGGALHSGGVNVLLADGSVRLADGSVRPVSGFSAGQDTRMDSK